MGMLLPVAVKCEISRGGFSGERVVAVTCFDGSTKKGLAPIDYCWTASKEKLTEDEPKNGNIIVGWVAARQYKKPSPNQVAIEIPDGEMMIVSTDSVIPRPESVSYVPV